MKKTRICTVAIMVAMLVSLAGCGDASPENAASATPPGQSSDVHAQSAPVAAETGQKPEDAVVRVSSVDGFLEAIAPGAVIEFAPGTYNLTEYLGGAPDEISDYVTRGFCADGWQAEINSVENLTIRGAEGGSVEVVVEPRHANVLCFSNCNDITIENITFGHTIEKGTCEGAVLGLDFCVNVTLDRLDLYGCGSYGVMSNYTTGMTLQDCVIHDCSYGAVSLNVCSGVTAKDCTFRDNSGYDLIDLYDSFALFDGCTFTGNTGDDFLRASAGYGNDSGARFERCVFGRAESEHLREELKGHGNYMFSSDCRFESEIGRQIVRVSSVEQLIESIAPDTEILLAPGRYNLSDGLAALLAQKGEGFAESLVYVKVNEEYDGPELVITGVSGLTIASESCSASDTEIVTEPRHADVMRFEDCSGIGVMNLTMGHTETGECAGDVLYFNGGNGIVLYGLDLYGCGVYGVGTNECGRLSCFDSTIRGCGYGALELCAARERQMFLNCAMTGSGGGGVFYASEESNGEFYFYHCTFGERESNYFAFDDAIRAENCVWSEITEYPDYSWEYDETEPVALDTTRIKTAPFDAQVLTDAQFFLCYESVNRQSGSVTFEPASAMRLLVFEKDGSGYFQGNDGTRQSFRYEMDSKYSCVLSFDDGRKGTVGLCSDQGGALPGSEEGNIWLQLDLGDEALWFY